MHQHSKRKVIILGCTGSIGSTALRALKKFSHNFEIVALSAHTSVDTLLSIASDWGCKKICISSDNHQNISQQTLPKETQLFRGKQGLLNMIRETDADVVLNGISGASGLEPTFAAIESNKDIALSNKESIVMGGDILFDYAKKHHSHIYPVDSEHSTLFALIGAHGKSAVSTLVLTASGGPFRNFPQKQMKDITVEMAVAHPTWNMGTKISIDSATLANKGLEVIEASYLFGFDAETIEVVIHPQSIVHSLIRLHSGAIYAQLTPPDIALPIMSALSQDATPPRDVVKPLDFTSLTLNFEKPDEVRFPLLKVAFDMVRYGKGYPIAYNAANEVAVSHFVNHSLRFDSISDVVVETLSHDWSDTYSTLSDIIEIDARVRGIAEKISQGMAT
jgi:1-deoxy-D-xylulose-5-phosphate reductoisomerase